MPAGSWVLSGFGDRATLGSFQVFLVGLAQKVKKVGHHRIDQEIAAQTAIGVVVDEAMSAQEAQVLGDVRLTGFEKVVKVADAFHAVFEHFEDLDSQGMPDYFQKLDSIPLDFFFCG